MLWIFLFQNILLYLICVWNNMYLLPFVVEMIVKTVTLHHETIRCQGNIFIQCCRFL